MLVALLCSRGEEHYELGKATELRLKLLKLYETVDVLSKKISALDTGDEENPPAPGALSLQNSVRRAAHAYLQVGVLSANLAMRLRTWHCLSWPVVRLARRKEIFSMG